MKMEKLSKKILNTALIYLWIFCSISCESGQPGIQDNNKNSADTLISMDLGKGFYYADNPKGSYIYFRPADTRGSIPRDTTLPKIVWIAIPGVTKFGYNDNIIMASSKSDVGRRYWWIDKRLPTEEAGSKNNGDRIILSNVYLIDSATFMDIQKKYLLQLDGGSADMRAG